MCSNNGGGCVTLETSRDDAFIQLGDHQLKFECNIFDAEDKEKARKELRETPEIVEKALEEFRKLLESK